MCPCSLALKVQNMWLELLERYVTLAPDLFVPPDPFGIEPILTWRVGLVVI